MIQVIDKISYLPKSPKSSIINENEIYNQAYKSLVEEIKNKMRRIDSSGKSATVTVNGRVVKQNTNIDVKVNCEDEDLLKRIESVLNG